MDCIYFLFFKINFDLIFFIFIFIFWFIFNLDLIFDCIFNFIFNFILISRNSFRKVNDGNRESYRTQGLEIFFNFFGFWFSKVRFCIISEEYPQIIFLGYRNSISNNISSLICLYWILNSPICFFNVFWYVFIFLEGMILNQIYF